MECNVNHLLNTLHELKISLNTVDSALDEILKEKHNDRIVVKILEHLSAKIIDPNYTKWIPIFFPEIIFPIVSHGIPIQESYDLDAARHQANCIALSELIATDHNVLRYAYKYFQCNKSPWAAATSSESPQKQKRTRTTKTAPTNLNEILKCCLKFLKSDEMFYRNAWNWSELIDTISTQTLDDTGTVLFNKILSVVLSISDVKFNELNSQVPAEILLQVDQDLFAQQPLPRSNKLPHNIQASSQFAEWLQSHGSVVNVEGAFLHTFNAENARYWQKALTVVSGTSQGLIKVDSTQRNLQNVALGIGSGKPVCLSGPVGSGKTSLIEYLAARTGRLPPKIRVKEEPMEEKTPLDKTRQNGSAKKRKSKVAQPEQDYVFPDNLTTATSGFLRIQLGHETDSKMLLGQYCCTDVPGEFVWQPGVLTQAVVNGHWLLLEDLDCATQDVCTVLTTLLENGYLNVPGFKDSIRIEPGFQLFFTIRTQNQVTSANTFFKLLEKHLFVVHVLPLSKTELIQVIAETYPKLATVAPKIVDVFLAFSSGGHIDEAELEEQDVDGMNGAMVRPRHRIAGGRLVSTRDLIKLCKRSNPTFLATSAECAFFVLQNAVDVLCSHMADGLEKTELIKTVGGKLGIIPSRCEYLAKEQKPHVDLNADSITVGRGSLKRYKTVAEKENKRLLNDVPKDGKTNKKQKVDEKSSVNVIRDVIEKVKQPPFSFTRLASCLLERVAISVQNNEPVLLVGETGVGKTSSVQYLAHQTGHTLTVVNMNNQSDVADLVGGFKPVDLKFIINPIRIEFDDLFRVTFNSMKNEAFLNKVLVCYRSGNYSVLVQTILKVCDHFYEKNRQSPDQFSNEIQARWHDMTMKLKKLDAQLNKSVNISFAFIPGSLVKCIKDGEWILLDEINLASTETLECLSTILEPDGSIVLLERGDLTPIKRHPDFRVFACMNPNTDIGKKDLPTGIRNRFTEYFVDELTTEADLTILVSDYLATSGIQKGRVLNIVKLYKKLKSMAQLELNDGLGNRPVYSLRTLCRALTICAKNYCGSIERNLYESFCLSFLTQVDPKSHLTVLSLIQKSLVQNINAVLAYEIPKPAGDPDGFLNFEGYWIALGSKEPQDCENYILTDSVRMNLKDLARIVSIGRLPVLLQGPTSAGKTSLIEYVARRSGNTFLRVNNHEHTDLQEYIGTYTTDATGKLVFKEGVLVQAMKHGHWIILDELNLAPSDILEALNRVLDDNRELFIPETQTIIKAHPNFMLFATQNPPGLYGGRKTLSRAFKNRFIELHFNEIPQSELEIILEKRCLIPKSYAQKMVKTMAELQVNRSNATKQNFTLRDLFRWGNRYTFACKDLLSNKLYDWNQHLVDEGYLVLSAKVRNVSETEMVAETLFRIFRKKVVLDDLFQLRSTSSMVTRKLLEDLTQLNENKNIVWTQDMRRMAIQAGKAIEFNEPVLLVGPTGCGKTTICQIFAQIYQRKLRILNCHLHTEAADFLGGLRPYRSGDHDVGEKQKLFEWADGPLIHSMEEGGYFLADEISLAEDSVLERLNSVLEPERRILLAEKIDNMMVDEQDSTITAADGFQFFATMNPGGDFGKKELSPALRNRFTEIWCRATDHPEDLINIATNSLGIHLDNVEQNRQIAEIIVDVIFALKSKLDKFNFSIRDVLSWIEYITTNYVKNLSLPEALLYGLQIIFLDFLEMIPNQNPSEISSLKTFMNELLSRRIKEQLQMDCCYTTLMERYNADVEFRVQEKQFGIKPFYLDAHQMNPEGNFKFSAPTTRRNLYQMLSALSLKKAILLEGAPGVGKTSLVESVAKAIGYELVRINLCEHTDLADLFGTDLPKEHDGEGEGSDALLGSFEWRDGPLMAALKAQNTWILLDELNLAPQNVLEGLNAILDHRGEVFIPELNKTFKISAKTRIFASQNPLGQGGGRKGLPQSFLNRFTKVYMNKLKDQDLLFVVNGRYGSQLSELVKQFVDQSGESDCANVLNLPDKMVKFSSDLERGITNFEFGHRGGPFEINLRDILQWCDFLLNPVTGFRFDAELPQPANYKNFNQVAFEKMSLVYSRRMRTEEDKDFIRQSYARHFNVDTGELDRIAKSVSFYWTDEAIYLNDIKIPKSTYDAVISKKVKKSPLILSSQLPLLRDLSECLLLAKPVLLCGPTDSGKTKSIDVMCSILNNHYEVDTIDDSVTGSFQQMDLNRHLEGSFKLAEQILFPEMIESAVKGKFKELRDSLRLWEKYSTEIPIASKSDQNLNAELMEFERKIQALEMIFKRIKLDPTHSGRKTVNFIKAFIKDSKTSLNTGGHFEWVDSKIVECLKFGRTICLEHVNLCSSAILDRLNSVFEQDGTLLIAEKALTSNNELEVISKHKDFRAFLTLDPRNGEISRAMRNRCIEIALRGDEEYAVDDLRRLVFDSGVGDVHLINQIITIHLRMNSINENIRPYSVSDLQKFAFLTMEYERLGHDDRSALRCSATEVYIRAAAVDLLGYGLSFYRCKLQAILETTLTEGDDDAVANNKSDDRDLFRRKNVINYENVCLRASELNSIARIRNQCEPFAVLLRCIRANVSAEVLRDTMAELNIDLERLYHAAHDSNGTINNDSLLRYILFTVFDVCSLEDLHLRKLYLCDLVGENHPTLRDIIERNANLVAAYLRDNPSTASDPTTLALLPWNRRMYPRIRDYALRPIDSGLMEIRLSLHLFYSSLAAALPSPSLDTPTPSSKSRSSKTSAASTAPMVFLTYSHALERKRIVDSTDDELIRKLYRILAECDEYFHKAIDRMAATSEKPPLALFAELSSVVAWRNRLLTAAQRLMYRPRKAMASSKPELHEENLNHLHLHFDWYRKRFNYATLTNSPLRQLEDGREGHSMEEGALVDQQTTTTRRKRKQPDERTCLDYDQLLDSVNKENNNARHPLDGVQKTFGKRLTHFLPIYHEDQVQLLHLLSSCDGKLTLKSALKPLSQSEIRQRLQISTSDEMFRFQSQFYESLSAPFAISSGDSGFADILSASDLDSLAPQFEALFNNITAATEMEVDGSVPAQSSTSCLNVESIALYGVYEFYAMNALRCDLFDPDNFARLNKDFFLRTKFTDLQMIQFVKVLTATDDWQRCVRRYENLLAKDSLADVLQQPEDALFYRNFSSLLRTVTRLQRQYLHDVIPTRTNLLKSRPTATRDDPCDNTEDELIDKNSFKVLPLDGPLFTDTLLSLLYTSHGSIAPVGLGQLRTWQQTLRQLQQLIWCNANAMTDTRKLMQNEFRSTRRNSEKLLKELDYVMRSQSTVTSADGDVVAAAAAVAALTPAQKFLNEFNELVTLLRSKTQATTRQIEMLSDRNQDEAKQRVPLLLLHDAHILTALNGAIELNVLCHFPLLDPVAKATLKRTYLDDDIADVHQLMVAYETLAIVCNYPMLAEDVRQELGQHRDQLQRKRNEMSVKVPLRPQECLYEALKRDVAHFMSTCAQPIVLKRMIDNFDSLFRHQLDYTDRSTNQKDAEQFLAQANDTVKRTELWLSNVDKFEHHTLPAYRVYYRDFVEPLCCALSALRHGFSGLVVAMTGKRDAVVKLDNGFYVDVNGPRIRLAGFLTNLIAFPTNFEAVARDVVPRYGDGDAAGQNKSTETGERANIYPLLERLPNGNVLLFNLLKTTLLEWTGKMERGQKLSRSDLVEQQSMLRVLNRIWCQQEEEKKKAKAEEASLYVTRVSCADPEDDEEHLAAELREHFPNYLQEDFGEFVHADLNDIIKPIQPQRSSTKTAGSKVHEVISQDDYRLICNSFMGTIVNVSACYFHKKGPAAAAGSAHVDMGLTAVDKGAAFGLKAEIFKRLFDQFKSTLCDSVDDAFWLGSATMVNTIQRHYEETPVTGKTYDFYKDSNVQEVVGCLDVLQEVRSRVRRELAQWPDHAVLNDILIIVGRMESLPVTSPIARFSTGLQLLQRKIGEWNSVAHKGNNLLDVEIKCAEYIQRWTKLELQCWRECLTHCQEKVQSQAHKFFFFFYNLVHEYLSDGQEQQTEDAVRANFNFKDYKSIEKHIRDGATEDDDLPPATATDETGEGDATRMNLSDILRLLNDFVENSNYGEFHLRLNMLKTFALYTSTLELSGEKGCEKRRDQLVAVLYNVHAYFQQFATVIDEHVKAVRAPIEKKLKEFVKIESYNKDLSYVGIRSNIVKIQKNVHKFFKEFEAQLKMKITASMEYKCRIADEHSAIKGQSGTDRKGKARPRHYVCDAKAFLVAKLEAGDVLSGASVIEQERGNLLPKISHFFMTSRNVVRQIINHCPVASRVQQLDELLLDEVENCDYLRGLEVDRSQERPKQKSQAKQILNQKRKALTDFYKTLTSIGVNHRTGLMEYNLRDSIIDFQVAPFCPRTQIYQEKTKRTDQSLVALCDRMDLHYAKAVFKVKTLLSVIVKPDSDMGVQNLERIKGFTIDLFMLIQYQRRQFSKSVRELQRLRETLDSLAMLSDCATVDGDQDFISNRQRLRALKSVALKTVSYCDQFRGLLRTVPAELDHSRYATTTSNRFDLSPHSELFKEINRILDRIQSTANTVYGDLIRIDEKSKFISSAVVDRNRSLAERISMDLRNLRDLFKATSTTDDRTEHHAYYSAIDKFIGSIRGTLNGNAQEGDERGGESRFLETDFCNHLENVVHSILISLQKLYKAQVPATKETMPTEGQELESRDESKLLENHLRENICQELTNNFELLNLRSIIKRLDVAINDVYQSGCTEATQTKIKRLLSTLPLLEQFGLLVEYFLIQSAGAHSVSVKILNVMLNVFIELVNNGFCVPKDLLGDEEPEKEKDQNGERTGEGMGLEDGTGEKDVSEKIENEDQLQDAKRPEEYDKDKGEEQQNKEEKGIDMSEDFDANLQDIEKKPEDEDEESSEKEDEDEDPDKQMGETEEGAEKLDDQIWGDEDKDSEDDEENGSEDEMNEEDGKGSNEEKEGHNDLDKGKEEQSEGKEDAGLDATDNDQDNRKKKQPDIDEMKEPQVDEDQINPYHNELEEPPEPEEMNIEDNVNLDGEDREEDNGEENRENPFDIDEMKNNIGEEQCEEEPPAETEGEGDKDKNDSDSSDDDDADGEDENLQKDQSNEEKVEAENEEDSNEIESKVEPEEEKPEQDEAEKQSPEDEEFYQAKDKASMQDNVQSMPENDPEAGSKDQAEVTPDATDEKKPQPTADQDTGEDKDGVGQAENQDSSTGHKGVAEVKSAEREASQKPDPKQKQDKSNKQGNTNEERTVAQNDRDKRLKTVDKLNEAREINEEEQADDANKEQHVEEYQHVKEAKRSDETTLDNATEEQSKQVRHQEETDKEEKMAPEDDDDNPDLMDVDAAEINEEKDEQAEKLKSEKAEQSKKSKNQKPSDELAEERDEDAEQVTVEGEDVLTMDVRRGTDTTAHCQMDVVRDASATETESTRDAMVMKRKIDAEMHNRTFAIAQQDDFSTWQTVSAKMMGSARDLCEQLRLILEPTKCTRLRGDYRTGRRINMKKIIPYLASQFRKDKIWLRRTKPAKRDYKITIAIDDSKSMHHNNSKELTLEAISLVSQALTLLESGRLSVVSFGEATKIVLTHSEQFDGPKLVKSLNFDQNQSRIAELLNFVRAYGQEDASGSAGDNGLFENLLLVLSDGRNIFSEGEQAVRNAIKLAKLRRIFIVYVIIDNPDNKHSVLDIKVPHFSADRKQITMSSYLDTFPFPYYVIVRDLTQLPSVLSDAMRQWFELVNSEQ